MTNYPPSFNTGIEETSTQQVSSIENFSIFQPKTQPSGSAKIPISNSISASKAGTQKSEKSGQSNCHTDSGFLGQNITHTDYTRNIGKTSVHPNQVETRSTEEINRERWGQIGIIDPYRFGPFTQFALAQDKKPAYKGWREKFLSGEAIAYRLNYSTHANGVIGIIPDGYCVMDFDGPKAMGCFLAWLGLSHLEPSKVWFSGDPKKGGLPKVLYRLSDVLELPGKKLVQKFADGNAVELLLPGHQVTLPGSFHSEERGYYQERGNYPVANAPEWLTELIGKKITERQERFNTANLKDVSESDRSVEKLLLTIDADDYDIWVEVGLSLKAMGDEYLDEFDQWSSTGRKYKGFHEVEKKWFSFNPTKIKNGYAHLCRLAGVKPPSTVQLNQDEKDKPLSKAEQRRQRAAENWVPLLSAQGEQQRQFFGDALADTIDNTKMGDRKLIAQAGPPGKGKSVSLQKASKTAQRKGYERLGFSYLETASQGMAKDMDIAYRKSNESGSTEVVSCANALIPDANGADWDKLARMDVSRITAFDEASEVAQALSGYRYDGRIKRGNGEKILSHTDIGIIQSATLKPYDVDFYRNIGGFKYDEVVIDAISAAPHPRNIYIHPPTPPQGINNKLVAIHQAIELAKTAKKNSIAIVLTCNSQRPTSDWGTSVIERHLQIYVGDRVNITRMDSQTTKDPANPAHYLAQEKDIYLDAGDLYVLSPSVETNTSFKPESGVEIITINIDTGNMTVERLLQSNRVRGVDGQIQEQHIFLSESKGKLKHRGALTPDEVLADIEDKEANHNVRLVQDVLSGEPLDKQSYVLQDYCKRVADNNCSLLGKSIILPRVLAEQGHNVNIVPQSDYEAITDELDQLRTDLDVSRQQASEEYYQRESTAQRRPKEWVEEKEKSGQYSEEEYYEIRRYKTESRLGNHLTRKIIDGAIEECDEGIELTPALIEAHEKRRLTTTWRRSFDLNQSLFDWLLSDISRLDGNVPSLIECSESKTAKNLALEQSGIAQFVRDYAIWEIKVNQDYNCILDASKPSQAFQRQIIQDNIDKAFSRENSTLKAIAQQLNPTGELEKLTSVLGVEVQRDKEGNVTVGNVLTIIRQFYGVATFKCNGIRADGQTGATILSFDDRADAIYRLTLKADKLDKINLTRNEIFSRINHEQNGVSRAMMFPVWDESRKVRGVMGMDDVSLFERELNTCLTNSDTTLTFSLSDWVAELGIKSQPAFEVGKRVTRTDFDGWGGVIKAVRDGLCDVLFDLEPATKAVSFGKLALA